MVDTLEVVYLIYFTASLNWFTSVLRLYLARLWGEG
jgi:hypothetical protein